MAVRLADIQKKQQPKAVGGLQNDKGHAARSLQAFRTPLPLVVESQPSEKPVTTDNNVAPGRPTQPITTDNSHSPGEVAAKPTTTDNKLGTAAVSHEPITTDNKPDVAAAADESIAIGNSVRDTASLGETKVTEERSAAVEAPKKPITIDNKGADTEAPNKPITTDNKAVASQLRTAGSSGESAAVREQGSQPVTTDNNGQAKAAAQPITRDTRAAFQPITKTDNNRQQTASEPITTGNKTAESVKQPITKTDNNRQQTASEPITTSKLTAKTPTVTGNNRQQTPQIPATTDNRSGELGQKPITVIGSDSDCYRLPDELLSVATPDLDTQPITVIGSSPACYRNEQTTETDNNRQHTQSQPITGTDNNRQQKRPVLPLPSGHQQLQLLELLERHQRATGLNHTPRLKRSALATEMGTTAGVVAMQINRLCDKGYVTRESVSVGRGTAGTVYKVSANAIHALKQRNRQQEPITTDNNRDVNRQQEPITTGNNNRQQQGRSSSSLNPTPTNLPDPAIQQAEELQALIDRFKLDDDLLRIGANDLLTAFRAQGGTFEAFARSVEHAAFYLRNSPDAKSLRHAKAWMMKTLREGYYPAPAGFISWEEEQERAEIADQKARLARLMAVRKEAFMTAFEVWKLELTPTETNRLLSGSFLTPSSPAADSVLREKFAEQTGQQKVLAYFSAAD